MVDLEILGSSVEPVALVFGDPQLNNGLILLESEALIVVLRHRQLTAQAPESGGILLGYRRGLHLHVTHATSPGPKDRAARVSFERKDPTHQNQARQAWEASNHTIDYLGEWHTHPEAMPSPSSTDRRAWDEILGRRKELYAFIIAGTLENMWVGRGEGNALTPLAPFANI